MQEILFDYKLNPTTWAYISALMMIGIYFKFHRFWSVRNLDLAALIAFSPAFLLIYHGLLTPRPELVRAGYVWLFAVGAFFFFRLLLDPVMVRRPLLEPNLSASGLAFTGVSLLVFMMANVITSPPERLEHLLAKQEAPALPDPGYPLFDTFSNISNQWMTSAGALPPEAHHRALIRVAANHTAVILAHLAVVIGMVWIGFRHFDNIHTGVAAATLYLLTFYTSQLTSQVDHVAPAALLVWAMAAYRRPMLAGILLGLAAGIIYYPLFLLPLWCGFYWRRGGVRFAVGVALALAVLVASLALPQVSRRDAQGPRPAATAFAAGQPTSPAGAVQPPRDSPSFAAQVRQMFGLRNPLDVTPSGFWKYYDPVYRIPVMTLFGAICLSLALWPAQKNLGTLLGCSAAVMLATQFWHANQGGLSMGWYLPLLILTVFRPNLEDRVALSAVKPMWGRRKKG